MLQRRSSLVVRSSARKTQLFLHVTGSVADSPEITGSASNVPTSTKNSQSTFTPQTTSPSSNSSNSSSKGGAIAGGVTGGIAGAALIAVVVAWITVRRRRARSALSAVAFYDQSDMGHGAILYPTVASAPRLYVRGCFPISADHMWSYEGIAR
jgi:hypothetical protein